MRKIVWIPILIIAAGATLLYLATGFHKLDGGVHSIKILLAEPLKSYPPVIYIMDSTEVAVNLKKPIPTRRENDSTLTADLYKGAKIRQFRIYFSPTTENIKIKSIRLGLPSDYSLNLQSVDQEGIQIIENEKQNLSFKVLSSEGYSYLQSPRFYYASDYGLILLSFIAVIFLCYLAFVFIRAIDSLFFLRAISWQELSVIAFIFSIFLPQIIFNLTLTISILLLIRDFDIKSFKNNKINFLFLAFYGVILLDFLLVTPDYDFKTIEKYTLFLVLPFYTSCIRSSKLLVSFCLSSFFLGGWFLFQSLIDIAIFKNIGIISFDNFTGEIHPVYYSYLVAFSILYIELNIFIKGKYLIQSILILFLILSGSKLVLFVTLIWFGFAVSKSVVKVIVPLGILALFLFVPLRERFGSIIDFRDLSVVTEDNIQDPDDKRLNGFTVRLIIWQENLNLIGINNILLGRGVSPAGSQAIELSLKKRGLLNHLSYNAHNQYITTASKNGLLGLGLLLSIIGYSILTAVRTKSRTLLYFTILMAFAMISESVFERIFGIAFFCLLLLLLTNPGTKPLTNTKSSTSIS